MKTFYLFFGAPGSGKGTQASLLSDEIEVPTIAFGNILRKRMQVDDEIGNLIKDLLDKGELIPDDIIESILDEEMKKEKYSGNIIFDGYPRTLDQSKLILKRLENNLENGDKLIVFYIKVEDDEVRKRFLGRRICSCGEVYHIEYNKPKKENVCDDCGKILYQRADDTFELIDKRLQVYHKQNDPILDFWKNTDYLISINGMQKIEKISKEILNAIKG